MSVRNSTVGAHINATGPWQPWLSSNGNRSIFTASPDGGAPDAGVATMAITTPLYTSADYYVLSGGVPSPAEVYTAECGNTTAP